MSAFIGVFEIAAPLILPKLKLLVKTSTETLHRKVLRETLLRN
jgi:hypothetical protein